MLSHHCNIKALGHIMLGNINFLSINATIYNSIWKKSISKTFTGTNKKGGEKHKR